MEKMWLAQFLSSLVILSIGVGASVLSYECLSIVENVRLTRVEELGLEDSATLLQCHQMCRERGYDACSVYVFDGEQEVCKMYSNEEAARGEEEEVLWNTLVRLRPDCFNEKLIGRGRRAQPTVATGGGYQGGQWAEWQAWAACSVTCGKGQQKRKRLCKTYQPCQGPTEETQDCLGPACAQISQWGPWGKCSAMCGGGTQTRLRTCPTPTYGACGNVSMAENQTCNPQTCCTEWGRWSACSVTCGQGTQRRTRRCMIDAPNTPTGYASQEKNETQPCNGTQPSCATWQNWAPWTDCSATCGGGNQTRQRVCSVPGQCPGNATESKQCNTEPCAEWGPWGSWSPCSDTCGGGFQIRQRNCTQGGKPSDKCPGDAKEKQLCNTVECPGYGQWQEWTACSQTCGGGTRTRGRECTVDTNFCTGANSTSPACTCSTVEGGGSTQENETCNGEECPSWTPWGEWSTCSATCGNGTQTRKRTCSRPDAPCTPGNDTETQSCDAGPCYTWSSWSEWGDCTTLCGGGSRNRSRQCPVSDGCPGLNDDSDICNMMPCPDWGDWSPWSDCTVSCGGGQRSRTHSCPIPKACTPGTEYENDPKPCSPNVCPSWSEWIAWSTCSKTCGQGNRQRKRTCSPVPDGCLGSGDNVEPCFDKPCTLSTNWSEWSPCTATCGGGTQTRSRVTCPAGPPTCPIEEGTQPCNPQACPQWAVWGAWGACSKTCGGGQRVRSRTCPVVNGCVGTASDIDPTPCNSFGCNTGRR